MTSSTWSFENEAPLIGVGVDAELVGRFAAFTPPDNPLPLVFSDDEVACAAGSPLPSAALCASYTFKEALFKALGSPIDPRAAKWVCGDDPARGEAVLDPSLVAEFGIGSVTVRVLFPHPRECVTIVHVFGGR